MSADQPGNEPLTLVKGHGTRNDFLLVPGADLTTAPPQVANALVVALCDRRGGIGADGLIRVVPPGVEGNGSLWFMDYRNADGSQSQMCGNGARVFVRFLVESGRVTPDDQGGMSIATRAGDHDVRVFEDGTIAVSMGVPSFPLVRALPMVTVDAHTWPATGVLMPNPHAVVFVDDLREAGRLVEAPDVAPDAAFPDGVNVEFVVVDAPGRLRMRVHERGSGETQSCGTGACAAVVAARLRDPDVAPEEWLVDVPGGRLIVTQTATGVELRGPAVLVATVVVADPGSLLA